MGSVAKGVQGQGINQERYDNRQRMKGAGGYGVRVCVCEGLELQVVPRRPRLTRERGSLRRNEDLDSSSRDRLALAWCGHASPLSKRMGSQEERQRKNTRDARQSVAPKKKKTNRG
jgi:hypothetical protein